MEFPDGVRVDKHVDGTATLSQNINGYSDTTYRKADGTMEKVMDGLVIDLRLTGELEINGNKSWQPTEMKGLLGEVFNRPKYENRFPKSSDFDRLKQHKFFGYRRKKDSPMAVSFSKYANSLH